MIGRCRCPLGERQWTTECERSTSWRHGGPQVSFVASDSILRKRLSLLRTAWWSCNQSDGSQRNFVVTLTCSRRSRVHHGRQSLVERLDQRKRRSCRKQSRLSQNCQTSLQRRPYRQKGVRRHGASTSVKRIWTNMDTQRPVRRVI